MSRAGIDWRAWWQLLRAANVFTAMSNVIAGFLLVQRDWQPLGPLLLLILSSVCLYEAGMVLNDVFDAELDAVERPERPIPSGRISKENAYWVGLVLLGGGNIAALFASVTIGQYLPIMFAIALSWKIWSYNAWEKSTSWGPLAMSTCRGLNVLLGASIATSLVGGVIMAGFLVGGVCFHTYGLTLISRSEAGSLKHIELTTGIGVVIAGLAWIAALPFTIGDLGIPVVAWFGVCILLLIIELLLARQLLTNPSQSCIRQTVGTLILMFIPLDAAASALAAGWSAGFCVLLLLLPVRLLSRWTGQT
ncbi:UbiA family prenyltransferase [Bythopirellula goksoeyrii]|uniref:Prenyltransferase n=1 Tax=Bythopirellula goksoeyrii TaxID=1400387 RepID=A0A5B9Q9V2_9BACT|nr:UbiA family prenyltransferase [Bythopirellula goksoeyrii]QEG35658.1 prenyltransferase [Bythopirellula goksoeyrii]